MDSRFNRIRELRSSGESRYNALTLSLKKRMSHGFQAQASYTLAKAEDHGLGGGFVVGSIDQPLTDPSNQDRDWGPTAWDTRHNFVLSAVNSVVRTGASGEPESALPSFFDVTSTYQARQFQLGAKLEF